MEWLTIKPNLGNVSRSVESLRSSSVRALQSLFQLLYFSKTVDFSVYKL